MPHSLKRTSIRLHWAPIAYTCLVFPSSMEAASFALTAVLVQTAQSEFRAGLLLLLWADEVLLCFT